ncbi:hypothetical protein [Gemmatimonas sp.]|uniref:hypothetical protein n=1 Tax=Gemmatimonas sp. TaxID=1962908 RepID=UPI003340B224
MSARRRISGLVILILQLVLGMRPVVALPMLAVVPAASIPDCHGAEMAPADSSTFDEHAGHHAGIVHQAAAPEPGASGSEDAPPPSHAPHHDGGCHGAPCCAPILPTTPIGAPTSTVAQGKLRSPLSGAALVVWSDGARRLPPATAPPTALLS